MIGLCEIVQHPGRFGVEIGALYQGLGDECGKGDSLPLATQPESTGEIIKFFVGLFPSHHVELTFYQTDLAAPFVLGNGGLPTGPFFFFFY